MHNTATSIANAEPTISIRNRTSFEIYVNGKHGRCPNHGQVRVKVVKTKFFETGQADLCSICNSVIQRPPAAKAPEPKPKKNKFVWSCFSCGAQFPEDRKLPVCLTNKNVTRRVCLECGEIVYLVEWKPEKK